MQWPLKLFKVKELIVKQTFVFTFVPRVYSLFAAHRAVFRC